MLWNRWDELTGNIRDGVRRRLHAIDAAGLDEERARAWVVVRVVRKPPANWRTHGLTTSRWPRPSD
jgi:hypothetical protein